MSRGMLVCGIVLALAICRTPVSAEESSKNQVEILGETNAFGFFTGNRFEGHWWLIGERLGIPVMLTLHRDGTVIHQTSLDTQAGRPFELTLAQGVWKRTGARSARAEFLRFRRNTEGDVTGFERLRQKLEFADDFDHIVGTAGIEVFSCDTVPAPPPRTDMVPSCPNPTEDVTGEFPPQVQNLRSTGTRVRLTRNR